MLTDNEFSSQYYDTVLSRKITYPEPPRVQRGGSRTICRDSVMTFSYVIPDTAHSSYVESIKDRIIGNYNFLKYIIKLLLIIVDGYYEMNTLGICYVNNMFN